METVSGCGHRPILLAPPAQNEALSALAVVPPILTLGYYLLPDSWQTHLAWQFAPQIMAWLCLVLWAGRNTEVLGKLGLAFENLRSGVQKGAALGLILGIVNTGVILYGASALGIDIEFLRHTPHAQVPPLVMVPWFILLIALGVELNFRGFLLGRFVSILSNRNRNPTSLTAPDMGMALGLSSMTFAFDPFMVTTFRDLHWIALWDGLIWGRFYLRTRNLYLVITAHAVEVIIEYLTIRAVLT